MKDDEQMEPGRRSGGGGSAVERQRQVDDG